jgi:hypothetical protein
MIRKYRSPAKGRENAERFAECGPDRANDSGLDDPLRERPLRAFARAPGGAAAPASAGPRKELWADRPVPISLGKPRMSHAYVIEINEEAVGLVVLQSGAAARERGYRFYAARPFYRAIEGRIFGSPGKAQKAAVALAGKERVPDNCLGPAVFPADPRAGLSPLRTYRSVG